MLPGHARKRTVTFSLKPTANDQSYASVIERRVTDAGAKR